VIEAGSSDFVEMIYEDTVTHTVASSDVTPTHRNTHVIVYCVCCVRVQRSDNQTGGIQFLELHYTVHQKPYPLSFRNAFSLNSDKYRVSQTQKRF